MLSRDSLTETYSTEEGQTRVICIKTVQVNMAVRQVFATHLDFSLEFMEDTDETSPLMVCGI